MSAPPAPLLQPSDLLNAATRHLFFTGKGGVGKTSHACALAVALADAGRRVLLVSTDPASNLSDVLQTPVGAEPGDVSGAPGLRAMNVDPAAATAAYREAALGPLRELLSPADLRKVEEQLSGACTTEIATFDRFTALLADPAQTADIDHIIFDTAPTGHTIRLLKLPAAWTGFLDDSPQGASCLGPAAGQEAQRVQFEAALNALRDATATTLYLVARPDAGSLAEASRTSHELGALGIGHQRLIINGVFRAQRASDALASALEADGARALSEMPSNLQSLDRLETVLHAGNVVGLAALRMLYAPRDDTPPEPVQRAPLPELPAFASLIDELALKQAGVILVMGKGGVGKTTLAAAVAVGLADRGHAVHLATTDPAAHLEAALPDAVPGIVVSRIDPEEESRQYRARVLRTRGAALDEAGRALLAEDLQSPCTEEVAVFQAFSRLLNEGRRGWVVLDTAPTGHTLLLLDTTGAYHREVLRTSEIPLERVTTPLMRLQNPEHTHVLLVALPETTPVEEARTLQEDLRRAQIEPWAWVINRSLAAASPGDALLAQRAANEVPIIERVRDRLANRLAVIPHLPHSPIGAAALRELSGADASLSSHP